MKEPKESSEPKQTTLTSAVTPTTAEPAVSFRAAMDELEGILERIEGEEIDIDQLATELRRAAQLLDICRGKIRRAEVEVTQIVQSLEEPEEG
jgi:exodeoxyribonuclease VII small subunit